MDFWILMGTALGLISLMMVMVWLYSIHLKNAGIVDVAWSWGFSPVAVLYALYAPGFPLRKALIAAMAVLWSLRLGGYLFIRVKALHPVEDARYHALKEEWGASADRKMLLFFLFQGVILVLLSVPFLLASRNPFPSIHWIEWLGVGLWVVALAGETLADAQLSRFKANPENRGKICEIGLWRYSRHPNYFFEWLIWVSFFTFAMGSPYGWVSFYCPAQMLYLLLKVTGIPALEAHAVKTKGEAYRAYQRRTSAFIPWFPKNV